MTTGTLNRGKLKVGPTSKPDNLGSDTKRDTHVSPEDGQEALLKAVKQRWDDFCNAGEKSFKRVVSLGQALDALKKAVKNGEDDADTWKEFVEREQAADNLPFGLRQADRYVSIYRRFDEDKITFDGGCIDFSFRGNGGGGGGAEKLGEISLGNKGTKEWRGAVRWTANGRLTLTWLDKNLAECMNEEDQLCKQAVEIGKRAFSLVARVNEMTVANRVLDFLNNTEKEVTQAAEEN